MKSNKLVSHKRVSHKPASHKSASHRLASHRLAKVQKALSRWHVDAFIATNSVDLFYLTGIEMSAGMLLVNKKEAYLIVDGRYEEQCKKQSPCKVLKMAPDVLSKHLPKKALVGFSQEGTSYSTYRRLKEQISGELKPLVRPIEALRAIKDASEIEMLERSARMLIAGYDFLCTRLRRRVFEKTLAKELEMFWLTSGADRLAFEPIIAFDKNSSMPHYRAGFAELHPNDTVLIDIGVVVGGYASDMTRMLFYGKPDSRIAKIYDVVLEAQMKTIRSIKPGVEASKLYDISKKTIDRAGYGEHYLHSLGHGIGLEVHEYPILRPESKGCVIERNMCLTVEPGIYLPNIGGVRIEDMVLVTATGQRILTDCPKAQVILPVV